MKSFLTFFNPCLALTLNLPGEGKAWTWSWFFFEIRNFVMTSSFSFLPPYTQEGKNIWMWPEWNLGELAIPFDACYITPWPLGQLQHIQTFIYCSPFFYVSLLIWFESFNAIISSTFLVHWDLAAWVFRASFEVKCFLAFNSSRLSRQPRQCGHDLHLLMRAASLGWSLLL